LQKEQLMKISFGMSLDGYQAAKPENRFGEVTTGPLGLLSILETRLGLVGIWPPQPVRVVQYLGCLQSVDDGKRFYSESFKVDGLAVAQTLLNWRDQWIMAGWNGTADEADPKRIRDLAAVEKVAAEKLGWGMGDRLRAVIAALAVSKSGITAVESLDPLTSLPTLWRKVLKTLQASERPVLPQPPRSRSRKSDDDLVRLQQAFTEGGDVGTKQKLKGDGSVVMLRAQTETVALKAVASLLAANQASSTAVLAGQFQASLDRALSATDQPETGGAWVSPWRPALQVLPMLLSLLWEPLDPLRLLEFLRLPVSPLPDKLRFPLAKVVAEHPGIGGSEWKKAVKAWSSSSTDKPSARRRSKGDPLDEWILFQRNDPTGATVDQVLALAQKVSQWAVGRIAMIQPEDPQRPLLIGARKQALELQHALEEWCSAGNDTISRVQLERLLDQVSAKGVSLPGRYANCGHVAVYDDPAMFIEAVDQVYWLDFTAPQMTSRWPWSKEELAGLRRSGAEFPVISDLLDQQAKTWLQPLQCAGKQLVLVLPPDNGDQADPYHPLWDQITGIVEVSTIQVIDADQYLRSGQSDLLLPSALVPVDQHSLPPLTRWWRLQDGRGLEPRDTAESFTSLEKILKSPYQWVMEYKARLKASPSLNLLGDNKQKGNLLHALLERLFNDDRLAWRTAKQSAVIEWIDINLKSLLEQVGANLLLPGETMARERLFDVAKKAIWELLQQLRKAKVITVAVERALTGSFAGGDLQGRTDLLVTNDKGKEAVIDVKWSDSGNYRRQELATNSHLQLVLYAVMRQQEQEGQYPSLAFFILQEARLLAQDQSYFPSATTCCVPDNIKPIKMIWSEILKTWQWRRRQLDKGEIELTVTGTEEMDMTEAPEDGLAIKQTNDHFNDFRVLTGWKEDA
jgi:RecB family exonuclease